MTDNELESLSLRAENGDLQACLEYANEIYKGPSASADQLKKAFIYCSKINLPDRSDPKYNEIWPLWNEVCKIKYYIYKRATDANAMPQSKKEVAYIVHCYEATDGFSNPNKEEVARLLTAFVEKCPNDLYNKFKDKLKYIWRDAICFAERNSINYHFPSELLQKIYYYYSQNVSMSEQKYYLEEAIQTGCTQTDAYETLLAMYLNAANYANELNKADCVLQKAQENHVRLRNYPELVAGIKYIQEGKFNNAIKELENIRFGEPGKIAKAWLHKIFYQNIAGDCFDLKKAADCADTTIFDDQKQLDKENYNKDIETEIPDLLTALQNSNKLIFDEIENRLGISLDNDTKERINGAPVIFSYKEEKNTYVPDYDKLVKLIEKAIKLLQKNSTNFCNNITPDEIDDLISKLQEIIESLKQGDFTQACQMAKTIQFGRYCETKDHNESANVFPGIEDSLQKANDLILGTYCPANNTITLYISNIFSVSSRDELRPEILLFGTYAHELFHAFHHVWIAKSTGGINQAGTDNDIVNESLTSYFEYVYVWCHFAQYDHKDVSGYKQENICEKDKVCDHIKNNWAGSVLLNQYAGAKYLKMLSENAQNESLFIKVFNESLNDPDAALETLVFFDNLFYGIGW